MSKINQVKPLILACSTPLLNLPLLWSAFAQIYFILTKRSEEVYKLVNEKESKRERVNDEFDDDDDDGDDDGDDDKRIYTFSPLLSNQPIDDV